MPAAVMYAVGRAKRDLRRSLEVVGHQIGEARFLAQLPQFDRAVLIGGALSGEPTRRSPCPWRAVCGSSRRRTQSKR